MWGWYDSQGGIFEDSATVYAPGTQADGWLTPNIWIILLNQYNSTETPICQGTTDKEFTIVPALIQTHIHRIEVESQ